MSVVLIGPSGAGKGTHAQKLAQQFDLVHVSTGDLFRQNLEERTALGILARRYMEQGELVPDEVVDAMVEAFIRKTDPNKSILFDGFPRTRYQARFLEELFAELRRKIDVVIYLKVPNDTVVNRLTGRLICSQCQASFHETMYPFESCPYDQCENGEYLYRREDDTPAMARTRLRVFHRAAAPLVYLYQRQGKLSVVDGTGEPDRVYNDLVATIESAQDHRARPVSPVEVEAIQALREAVETLPPEEAALPSLDLVLLGAPGSGKGTQAEQLSRELDLVHIATGDIFRTNLKNETELGKLAKTYMDRGELVPDTVTEAMVRDRLSQPDTQNGFILDGFPRTLHQAEALTEMLTEMRRRLAGVIYINVSDEEIVKRLSGRLICRECQVPFHKVFNPFKSCPYNKCEGEYLYQREDDNPETVRNRLRTYHRQTEPLTDYYRQAGLLHEVDGEGEVQAITDRTLSLARSLQK